MLLPHVIEFAYRYLALQKIGAIPIMALPAHRYHEVSQFVALSGAVAMVTPDKARDFDFTTLINRIREESPAMRLGIILGDALGDAPAGLRSLADLPTRDAQTTASALDAIIFDPQNPHLVQPSGGPPGSPRSPVVGAHPGVTARSRG